MSITNEVLAERIDNLSKNLDRVSKEFRTSVEVASADRRRMYEAQEDTNLRLQAFELRMGLIEPQTQAFAVWREQAKGAAKLAKMLPKLFGGAVLAGLIYLTSKLPDIFK